MLHYPVNFLGCLFKLTVFDWDISSIHVQKSCFNDFIWHCSLYFHIFMDGVKNFSLIVFLGLEVTLFLITLELKNSLQQLLHKCSKRGLSTQLKFNLRLWNQLTCMHKPQHHQICTCFFIMFYLCCKSNKGTRCWKMLLAGLQNHWFSKNINLALVIDRMVNDRATVFGYVLDN